MMTSSLWFFLKFVYKTCQRQPAALQLFRLIVHLKFYKICKSESHVTRNDVIMMPLPKTVEDNGKMRTSEEPNKIYIVGKVFMRATIFIEFEPLCQKLWAFYVKFTKTTHQIWSCHLTLASNSENFYFSPNSVLNFRKIYQILGKLAQEPKRYRQKRNWRCL